MQNILKNICLILFFVYSAFFFFGSILAPITAHFQLYKLSAELTATFMFSCHQEPDRSFWILGYPVALCCRCLGIYLGCIISSLLALFNKLNIRLSIFVILFIICCIDIFINYGLGIRLHNTGNILRFVIGIIMGVLITTVIQYVLSLRIKEKNNES